MADTENKTRRRKASKESLEVARTISEEVIPKAEPIEEAPKPEEAIEQATPAVELPKVERASKSLEPELPKIDVAKAARPVKNVRVKATATIRGMVGNFAYNIKAGEIYTLPEHVANWLAERGRVI